MYINKIWKKDLSVSHIYRFMNSIKYNGFFFKIVTLVINEYDEFFSVINEYDEHLSGVNEYDEFLSLFNEYVELLSVSNEYDDIFIYIHLIQLIHLFCVPK